MRVFQFSTGDELLTSPKRETFGITFALRGGDVCHPTGEGNWFKEPFFTSSLRFWCGFTLLPWISWNLWGWKGYLGAKFYGADSPTYSSWIKEEEIYPGSTAIHFSGRLKISD